jgi:hypothetical protein
MKKILKEFEQTKMKVHQFVVNIQIRRSDGIQMSGVKCKKNH